MTFKVDKPRLWQQCVYLIVYIVRQYTNIKLGIFKTTVEPITTPVHLSYPVIVRSLDTSDDNLTISPVPCVISFTFLGDLLNYTFFETLGHTEPEK